MAFTAILSKVGLHITEIVSQETEAVLHCLGKRRVGWEVVIVPGLQVISHLESG